MLKASVKFIKCSFSCLIFCLVLPLAIYAAEPSPFVKEFSLMTGYACSKLESKDDYKVIPAMIRLGYNLNTIGLGFTDLLKPVFDKLHIVPKGYTELVVEPFLNTVISPDSNIEAGATLLLKYAYPLTDKLYPYGIAGAGVIFLTQHTREQSTQYNFTPQVGAGIACFIKKNLSVNLECRYRHLSNANLKEPNEGINVTMFLIGTSWYY